MLYLSTLVILALLLGAGFSKLFCSQQVVAVLYYITLSAFPFPSPAFQYPFSNLLNFVVYFVGVILNPKASEKRTFLLHGFGCVTSHLNQICRIIFWFPFCRVHMHNYFGLTSPKSSSISTCFSVKSKVLFFIIIWILLHCFGNAQKSKCKGGQKQKMSGCLAAKQTLYVVSGAVPK